MKKVFFGRHLGFLIFTEFYYINKLYVDPRFVRGITHENATIIAGVILYYVKKDGRRPPSWILRSGLVSFIFLIVMARTITGPKMGDFASICTIFEYFGLSNSAMIIEAASVLI